jgi:Mg-chelatase subunit ChlD
MSERRPAASCVEIRILWGEAPLHVAHLEPPRPFVLGTDAGCDFVLPHEALGARRVTLIDLDPKGPVIVAPHEMEASLVDARGKRVLKADERIPLVLDQSVRLELGDITIVIEHTASEPVFAPRRNLHRRFAAFALGAALVHAGVLIASSHAKPAAQDDEDGVTSEHMATIQQMLAHADEREMEEREVEQVAENTADLKEGGTGARAMGEEGSMGAPDSAHRYGVQGPTEDPHIARQEAMKQAAEFGMIGLLNSGSGGDPNAPTAPWGRDDSLGTGLGSIGTIGHGTGVGGGGLAQGYGSGAAPRGARSLVANAPSVPSNSAPSGGLAGPALSYDSLPTETKIDPNGRFATTYRPGGGHLAAFESALARGILPSADRELVSDVGARYVSALAAPKDSALAVSADLERSLAAPSGGPMHLRVSLRSTEEAPHARAHLSVHLVLDISGSMAGESITRAREAADALVDKLAPTDDFSLVTFSSDARVVVGDGPVGTRRTAIHEIIKTIHDEGGTNIGAGLALGYEQATQKSIPDDAVRVVLLLSDGRANAGITSRDRLANLALDAFQHGIQTSSFGLGADYDGPLMSSIARDGAGGYYYLRDGAQIRDALATEVERRLDPVATAVELRVRLKKDVDVLKVYGSRRLTEQEARTVRSQEVAADVIAAKHDKIAADRQDDTEGGMRFFMPAFTRDDAHAVLLKLRLPPGIGERDVASIELKYKDRVHGKNMSQELLAKVGYANGDAASAASMSPSVARSVQGFAAGEALLDASTRIAAKDRDGALALLVEREAILREGARMLGEPGLARDAERLATLRKHAGMTDEGGDPLVLAMLIETAAISHLR